MDFYMRMEAQIISYADTQSVYNNLLCFDTLLGMRDGRLIYGGRKDTVKGSLEERNRNRNRNAAEGKISKRETDFNVYAGEILYCIA